MKAILAGIAAGLALTVAPALAADIPVRAPSRVYTPAAIPVAAYNWTGFYSASGFGGAWWDIQGDYVIGPPDHHNTNDIRFVYSSMYGAQFQWGSVVLGVEGAYNVLYGKSYASTVSPSGDCNASAGGFTCNSRVDNIWTAGARLGYAWDRFMLFGTGGYANGHVYTQTTFTGTNIVSSQTDARQGGWYAGVGFEWFWTKIWMSDVIFGAEYQHIDLGSVRHFDQVSGVLDTATRDMSATVDIVRARLVFKWTP